MIEMPCDEPGGGDLQRDAEGFTAPVEPEGRAPRAMPPNAGKGRPKGSRNRASTELGAMVDKALHEAGGWRYLVQQARDNPTAFLALVARRLPKEIRAEITAEMTVKQETRRELIERSVALMLAIERGELQRVAMSERRAGEGVRVEHGDGRTGRALPPGEGGTGGARPSAQLPPLALHGPASTPHERNT